MDTRRDRAFVPAAQAMSMDGISTREVVIPRPQNGVWGFTLDAAAPKRISALAADGAAAAAV